MQVAIVTIGDEILIGQIVDTNSAWMAQQLTSKGFEVAEIRSVADKATAIRQTLDELFVRYDCILVTGGIGPTKDDITKNTLCEYFGTELIFSEEVYENVLKVLGNRMKMNDLTRNQALVPQQCTVIQNRVGTAPITWFERNGKVLVSMPGVPMEMQWAMTHEVLPRLTDCFRKDAYLSAVMMVTKHPESALAIKLQAFEEALPQDFGLAYLPSPALVKLRLFAYGSRHEVEFRRLSAALKQLLGDALLCEGDFSLEEVLSHKLRKHNLTVATAESCTGGNVARLISSVPGASTYFRGSVVAYATDVKNALLQVDSDVTQQHGVVSEAVVQAMAEGICRQLSSDCAIATSGIAGPDGGTEQTPVGTICIATKCKDTVVAKTYRFGNNREFNILRATNNALVQLMEMMD